MSEVQPLSDAELEQIRKRVEKATPGPWAWGGNITGRDIMLVATRQALRPIVMGFERWGMQGAQPQFRDGQRDVMVPASELLICPQSHNPWLVGGVNHPDADFIAHARDDVERLIHTLDELRADLEVEREWARNGYPG